MSWKRAWSGVLAAAVSLVAADASALLIEANVEDDPDSLELTYFYPYPTTYTFVDDGYDFDDDPLEAFVREPYFMPVVVRRREVRRSMVEPRKSFVHEMVRSTSGI